MCHFLESVLSSPKRLVTTFLRSSQPRNLFPSLEAVCPGSPCLQPHCCSPPDTLLLLMWRFLGRFQHSSSFGPDSSFFRWDNWEPKRERDLFKVTHLRVTEQGLILIPSQMLLQKGCYVTSPWCSWSGLRQPVMVQRQTCQDSHPCWVEWTVYWVSLWQRRLEVV